MLLGGSVAPGQKVQAAPGPHILLFFIMSIPRHCFKPYDSFPTPVSRFFGLHGLQLLILFSVCSAARSCRDKAVEWRLPR